MRSAASASSKMLSALPPFILFGTFRRRASVLPLVRGHLVVMCSLYGVFLLVSYIDGTAYIPLGIGVLQNPPFFGQLISAGVSIPLMVLLASRVAALNGPATDFATATASELSKRRFPTAFYFMSFGVGLMSLSYSVALASSYGIDIYDSARHPLSLISYSVIRIYEYLFCYPFVVVSTISIAICFFTIIRRSELRFQPFHVDGLGGMRQYLEAVDKPTYALQVSILIIPLANYFGWGGFSTVPIVLVVVAPTLVMALGLCVYLLFLTTLREKKKIEIDRLRMRQAELLAHLDSKLDDRTTLALIVSDIDAIDRLVEIIRKRPSFAWLKYVVTYVVTIATRLPLQTWFAELHIGHLF